MTLKLPALAEPQRYAGLYIFDFGDHVSVGYTAREIGFLLESDEYKSGKVYKIHRAAADGTLEIRGLGRPHFAAEQTMLFVRHDPAAARADFDVLSKQAEDHSPPCPAKLELVELGGSPPAHATVLIYAAADSQELGAWLNAVGFAGGDFVESLGAGGVVDRPACTLASRRLDPPPERSSRSYQEVLATTHLALQR